VHTGFLVEKLRERRHLEDLCLGESITLEWISSEIGCNWMDLAHDRHKFRAVVDEVMNRRSPQNTGSFLTCGRLLDSQEKHSSVLLFS